MQYFVGIEEVKNSMGIAIEVEVVEVVNVVTDSMGIVEVVNVIMDSIGIVLVLQVIAIVIIEDLVISSS
jgi:hypothetical protein